MDLGLLELLGLLGLQELQYTLLATSQESSLAASLADSQLFL